MSASDRDRRLASLFARTHAGIKPGLELTRALLSALGNPQERVLSLHVAGTNGKGSVCAMVEAGLREAGLRTGLYTSPHLIRVNERVRVAGVPVSDEAFYRALDRVEAVEGELERLPTFFETLTVIAFLVFAEEGVQIAVLETGMGGRLDCTNVVTPLLSVITRIDMDHQLFLGDTLEKVAGEKAGIIKAGRPVVVGAQREAAEAVVLARAAEVESPVIRAVERVGISGLKSTPKGRRLTVSTPALDMGRVELSLPGPYQVENLCAAVAAMEESARLLGLPDEAEWIRRGLETVDWPGRGQWLSETPPVILDLAHNPGGALALRELLRERFGRKARGAFVLASMEDKDQAEMLRILKPVMAEALCVGLENPRALPAERLAVLVRRAGVPAEATTVASARLELPRRAAAAGFGCVTGSAYLAGAWLAEETPDAGESMGAPRRSDPHRRVTRR